MAELLTKRTKDTQKQFRAQTTHFVSFVYFRDNSYCLDFAR